MPLVSTSALQAHTGETDASLLARLESAWVAWLENSTGRDLGPEGERATLIRGDRRREEIVLPSPIPTGGLVAVEQRSTGTTFEVLADVSDFEVRGQVLRWPHHDFPAADLQIRWNGGYAEDAGPADIHGLVLELVAWQLAQAAARGIKSVGLGPIRVSFSEGELPGYLQHQIGAAREAVL